jgi:hydroxymethylpyrimidine/phosphomethylpyrimidine kinase
VALTIAGSDSGGGAGVQADLKTFAALGVHGTSAVTCITAQNPTGVLAIQACTPNIVRRQIEAVFAELPPAAVKTGMLFSADIIRVVVNFFRSGKRPPLIVDPVMIATSGARLLDKSGIELLREKLLPLAALVTPNLSEAQALAGCRIAEPEDLRLAARLIQKKFDCAVLVKGGHLPDTSEAIDIFYDGRTELLLSAPRRKGIALHGAGCTCSAAVAAYCALGDALPKAVERAKTFITRAIAQCRQTGSHFVFHHGKPSQQARCNTRTS